MAIQFQIVGHVAVITLDAPDAHNALTIGDLIHLRKVLGTCQDDDQVRVIVLTGRGEQAFCAGVNLKENLPVPGSLASAALKSREAEAEEGGYARLFDLSDLEIWKPIIAAINGQCLGGGLELALQCDLRIAAVDACFALPEVTQASVPLAGGVQYLLRTVAAAHAMKLALTGARIDSDEALRIGLISECVQHERLMPTAMALAQCIAANGPLAVQASKRLALQTAHLSPRDFVAQTHLVWGLLRDSKDRQEGQNATAQGRAPRYTGA
ncbi:enoyl-CoA hydratase/isomerase family protein [Aquipseudomonas ullengensis]|uniref:Enoyl-CoA hydratase/isomerase family protein n=1 Tax=Aquipseudomonas ullengensis TaxID=2759166 RepID=A0A7W4LPV4_9GAMM|nr:enoyl-CoA hydratase-related protein [Pseudomonas ullengensis]MBB2497097.1 enoyl-CoA hydratase/isomerase family protein [Pseudomonas ullengensis]